MRLNKCMGTKREKNETSFCSQVQNQPWPFLFSLFLLALLHFLLSFDRHFCPPCLRPASESPLLGMMTQSEVWSQALSMVIVRKLRRAAHPSLLMRIPISLIMRIPMPLYWWVSNFLFFWRLYNKDSFNLISKTFLSCSFPRHLFFGQRIYLSHPNLHCLKFCLDRHSMHHHWECLLSSWKIASLYAASRFSWTNCHLLFILSSLISDRIYLSYMKQSSWTVVVILLKNPKFLSPGSFVLWRRRLVASFAAEQSIALEVFQKLYLQEWARITF